MDGFDLTEARLIRLRQDIDALLPFHDPQVRQEIFRLLAMGTRKGLDLFPRFRNAIGYRPTPPAPGDGTGSADGRGSEMEALPDRHRARLWPSGPKLQRPGRRAAGCCAASGGAARVRVCIRRRWAANRRLTFLGATQRR